jgi:hypothetical protein
MKFALLILFLAMPHFANAAACLKDVEASFLRVKDEVVPLSSWTHDVFDRGSYRQLIKTRLGLDNHIQGLVRVPGTTNFILSGADKYLKEASLFVAGFNTEDGAGLISKNFSNKKATDTPKEDGYISKLDIGTKEYWHAGGIAILDRILIVPIENHDTKASKIIFFDLTDPLRPEKLQVEIVRPHSTTGTVLIYRKANAKLIVGGSVDGLIEFYESKTADINDGFLPGSKILQTLANGQGTDIVQQCDGKTFIIDFNNSSKYAPIIWGKNNIRLFSLSSDLMETKLIHSRFMNTKRYCNFNAAGSHYITEAQKLTFYGSSFYRHSGGRQFKMCQFSE